MASYNTPGIYLNRQEPLTQQAINSESAVPAFIGFTQNVGMVNDESAINKVTKVRTLSEYESIFGLSQNEKFHVKFNKSTDDFELMDTSLSAEEATMSNFFHQSIALYFSNGGSDCYVISIGKHIDEHSCLVADDFMRAIDLLEEVEDVTLLSIPESILLDSTEHYQVQQYALQHCEKMQNRFFLLDVKQKDGIEKGKLENDIDDMRLNINQSLNYGAAYYPYVRTNQPRSYSESEITVEYQLTTKVLHNDYSNNFVTLNNQSTDQYGYLNDTSYKGTNAGPNVVYIRISNNTLVDNMGFKVDDKGVRLPGIPAYGIFTDNRGLHYLDHQGFIVDDTEKNKASHFKKSLATQVLSLTAKLSYLADAKWSLASPTVHSAVSQILAKNYRVLPPSSLVAGMICQTDKSVGVWRAPANIALENIIEPCVAIDNGEQQQMNVDLISGKSVNAIRHFIGKSPLLWGARTLNGNSDEWRYISVRRLFNRVESYLKMATQFSVFEQNIPFTWLKIKTIIENYLESIWEQGALFGQVSEEAFFVNVGLGKTMTPQDVYNGIIHIEVGLAAVRPAEFVIITFTRETTKA